MARLSLDQIQQQLQNLQGWKFGNNAITKQFTLKGFGAAMALVNKVAEAAQKANHHPDIVINYNRVTFTCSTHDAGGVTDKDIALAKQIEAAARP
ncbi:MAG: 4a-hydroxytetrahydrobiopterin dehydratase [candidate division NC10 bacterium]